VRVPREIHGMRVRNGHQGNGLNRYGITTPDLTDQCWDSIATWVSLTQPLMLSNESAEKGCSSRAVIGLDLLEKMLAGAEADTCDSAIEYRRCAIEEIHFADGKFDIVISSWHCTTSSSSAWFAGISIAGL
jgi:Methyltransferase domain